MSPKMQTLTIQQLEHLEAFEQLRFPRDFRPDLPIEEDNRPLHNDEQPGEVDEHDTNRS